VRLELHAEDLAGQRLTSSIELGELDAAALAAAAGVDLGLDDPDLPPSFCAASPTRLRAR
jgi:hypothetical protein